MKPAESTTVRRAFRCWVPKIIDSNTPPEENGIYLAETASKARYKCYLSVHDAGFDFITLRDITARRAPEFDTMDPRHSGWMAQYVDVGDTP